MNNLISIKNFVLLQSSGATSNWSNYVSALAQFFFYVLVFAIVLFLAYYSTKLIAGAKYAKKGSANIQILESASISVTSSLQLIRTGQKYFVIAVSKDGVTFLTEVSKEDLTFAEARISENKITFENYLSKFISKKKS